MIIWVMKIFFVWFFCVGFPGGSDGKVSACNAGDPGSIPGSGISFMNVEVRISGFAMI